MLQVCVVSCILEYESHDSDSGDKSILNRITSRLSVSPNIPSPLSSKIAKVWTEDELEVIDKKNPISFKKHSVDTSKGSSIQLFNVTFSERENKTPIILFDIAVSNQQNKEHFSIGYEKLKSDLITLKKIYYDCSFSDRFVIILCVESQEKLITFIDNVYNKLLRNTIIDRDDINSRDFYRSSDKIGGIIKRTNHGGDVSVSQSFYQQEKAFHYFDNHLFDMVRSKAKIFSFETIQFGKRLFLVIDIHSFFREYFKIESKNR